MGVLDHLKPPRVASTPPKTAPALPDRHAGVPPKTGDTLLDRQVATIAAPLELLTKHDAEGVWKPPTGYRGGNRRAAAILGHYTGDGEELLVWMLLLARGQIGAPRRYVYSDGSSEIKFDGPPPDLQIMADATKWCADRIFGKAPETVLSVTKNLDAHEINLDALSTEQLRALGEILRTPVTIDAKPEPVKPEP